MEARQSRRHPSTEIEQGGRWPVANNQEFATITEARLETTEASRLRELVAHLRQQRAQLREEWARLITEAKLLTAMTKEEIFAEATSVYDNYVEALETGTYEALQAYARNLSERDRKSTRLNSSHSQISYAVF